MEISELLTISKLEGIKIIAGESGKSRKVESVTMMDAPDIIPYLTKNEFLVTTAYHVKDQPHMLTELVQALSDVGCAGLGIKTKRFLDEIPTDVIKLADRLSLPILELPANLSLGVIVSHTFQSILDKKAEELALALETHKQFTNIIMQGKGVHSLLKDLSQMIRRPVQLIDQHFKVIYQTRHTTESFPSINESLSKNTKSTFISFSLIDTKQTLTLFPVQINEKKNGYLLIYGEVLQTDRFIVLTIEQASNVISFTLMKENALKYQQRRIRNDFFLHFIDGTFSSNEEIIGRAAEFSLRNDRKYMCVVGKVDEKNLISTYTQRHEKVADIFDFIEGEVITLTPPVHFFKKTEACILLFEIEESENQPLKHIETILMQLQKRISDLFSNTISFGIGNLCHHFLHVRNGYQEAEDAFSQGGFYKKTAFIHHYRTKNIMEIMRQIPKNDLENFYSSALNGFKIEGSEEEASLLETLSVYLETHCQISETAKRLFVHRNTVVYRIEKCEEILGKSLKDPENTLQLRMALRMKPLLEI